jgi:hypothetical protein
MATGGFKMTASFSFPMTVKECLPQHIYVITIPPTMAQHWLAALQQLQAKELGALTVSTTDSLVRLRVSVDHTLERSIIGFVRWNTKQAYLSISSNQLAYWISFFRPYAATGRAQVDHIDVDVNSAKHIEPGLFLVLKVADSMPSISETETRRRLSRGKK